MRTALVSAALAAAGLFAVASVAIVFIFLFVENHWDDGQAGAGAAISGILGFIMTIILIWIAWGVATAR